MAGDRKAVISLASMRPYIQSPKLKINPSIKKIIKKKLEILRGEKEQEYLHIVWNLGTLPS